MMVRGAKPLFGRANDVGPLLCRESLHNEFLNSFFKDLFNQERTDRPKHANAGLHGFRVCLVKAAKSMFSHQNEFAAMFRHPFPFVPMKEGEFIAELRGLMFSQNFGRVLYLSH
jgi:hypothetical protein